MKIGEIFTMKTLIDKINHFENCTNGTVKDFNEIFDVKLEGLDQSLEVEIGELCDTETTRLLTVGTLIIKHNFTPERELIPEYDPSENSKKGVKIPLGHKEKIHGNTRMY